MRTGMKMGGRNPVNPTNNDVQEAARFAITQISRETNARVGLVKVIEAQTQVVAGINYFLRLQTTQGEINAVVFKPLSGPPKLNGWR